MRGNQEKPVGPLRPGRLGRLDLYIRRMTALCFAVCVHFLPLRDVLCSNRVKLAIERNRDVQRAADREAAYCVGQSHTKQNAELRFSRTPVPVHRMQFEISLRNSIPGKVLFQRLQIAFMQLLPESSVRKNFDQGAR